MIPNTTSIADAWQELEQASVKFLSAMEHVQGNPRVNDQLVIASAMKALRRCRGAEGLSPDARKEVNSAYRMCRAAMGIDDAT